jgi:hypothetical protein
LLICGIGDGGKKGIIVTGLPELWKGNRKWEERGKISKSNKG